jgi:hypothetical protein
VCKPYASIGELDLRDGMVTDLENLRKVGELWNGFKFMVDRSLQFSERLACSIFQDYKHERFPGKFLQRPGHE